MNSKGSKLSLLLALLTLTTAAAAASPAEMYMFPQSSDVRIDSFTEYQIEIENTGTTEDVYTISSPNEAVTVEPSRIPENTGETLAPGESKELYVFYNPPTDTEAGTYSFTVNAESRGSGETYSVQGQANVIRGHDIEMTTDSTQTVCRGEQAEHQLVLENKGMQPEEFQLTTDRGDLSQSTVNLAEGETKTVTVTTSSETATQDSFNVVAASTTSYAQDIQTLNLNVETCYTSDLSITPENQRTAAYTESGFDLTVRNLGTKADTFTLSSSNGEFTSNQVEVGSESTETVTLSYTPEELGTTSLDISAEGKSSASQTVQIESYNGMEVQTSFNQNSYQVCENQEQRVGLKVENTGEATDTFSLSTNEGELRTDEVELEAGESRTVPISVSGSDYEENSEVTVNAEAVSQTFEETTDSVTTSLTVDNCWDLEMNVVPTVLSAGENRSAVFEVKLENTASKENTYRLDHKGPDWISLRPEKVTVAPGETGNAYIYAGIPYEKKGEVQITAEAVGTNVTESEEVTLVVGKEVEEAIQEDQNRITGAFSSIGDSFTGLADSNTLVKLLGALIAGAALTGFILYRETR